MGGRVGQGEALAVWLMWLATTVAVLVTYSVLPPEETYNVTHEGIVGGLSRALVHVDYPIALVAIPITLVALAVLPHRAWWVGAPALALCATVPLVVDQARLDARWGNALPAVGVALAAALTVAAGRRVGWSWQPRRRGDAARIVIAVIVAVLSLPWLSALVGVHLPGDVFMGEELFTTGDGRPEAAVHLGTHHGLYGSLLLCSGLALSRVVLAPGRLRLALLATTSALVAYGAVNAVQDFWLEQLVKRGWVDWRIPSAILPDADVVTATWVLLAVAVGWLLVRERAILRA